jgi:putative YhbY family RNA-binding protein
MKELTPAERRAMRARAHRLHPLVMIGNAGLTPAVLKEIDIALKSHELIKIRMLGEDRVAREHAIDAICDSLDASPVQVIGKMIVVYRAAPEPEKKAQPSVRKKPPRRNKRSRN